MQEPEVSIGIPVYNEEKYLAKTIESALNQTYRKIKILISDNCSTDNSYKIAKEYESKDSRIIVFKQPKNILTGNFKFLLEKATTEYFCFLGGHDIIKSNYIEEVVKVFNSNSKIVGVYPQMGAIENDVFIDKDFKRGDAFNTLNLNMYNSFINIIKYFRYGNSYYGVYKREVMLKTFITGKISDGDLGVALRVALFGYIVPTPEIFIYFRMIRPHETIDQKNIRYKGYGFPDNWLLQNAAYPYELVIGSKSLSFNENVKLSIDIQLEMRNYNRLSWLKLIGFYFGKFKLKTTFILFISYLRFLYREARK